MIVLGLAAALAGLTATAVGQPPSQKSQKKDEEFVKAHPRAGEPLPDETVYTPDGKELRTGGLRGHYTVLTFGCLT